MCFVIVFVEKIEDNIELIMLKLVQWMDFEQYINQMPFAFKTTEN